MKARHDFQVWEYCAPRAALRADSPLLLAQTLKIILISSPRLLLLTSRYILSKVISQDCSESKTSDLQRKETEAVYTAPDRYSQVFLPDLTTATDRLSYEVIKKYQVHTRLR